MHGRDPARSCRIENVYGRGYRFVMHGGTDDLADPAAPSADETSESLASSTVDLIARESELTRLQKLRNEARAGNTRLVLVDGTLESATGSGGAGNLGAMPRRAVALPALAGDSLSPLSTEPCG